jgi:hypothetical protein
MEKVDGDSYVPGLNDPVIMEGQSSERHLRYIPT